MRQETVDVLIWELERIDSDLAELDRRETNAQEHLVRLGRQRTLLSSRRAAIAEDTPLSSQEAAS